MRKIILFNLVTVDGFFEGPGADISWHNVDEEFNNFALHQLDQNGGLLFGRKTYQMMASYWPTSAAIQDDPLVAKKMNSLPKWVFSHTLQKAEWNNTTLVKGDLEQEVNKLKQQPGLDLYLFGSANLATALARLCLIDEYRLLVNPIILGGGTSLFKDVHERLNLKLLQARTFQNGNVLLSYAPESQ